MARRGERRVSPAATRRRELLSGRDRRAGSQVAAGDTPRSQCPSKVLLEVSFALLAACALLVGAGCGESEGVAENATVSVYAAASLCAEAQQELARDGGRAGDVRVHVICLPSAESSQKLNLATIGANARRASEDSTAVGYIGEPTRAASRFSQPILEEAGIAQFAAGSGAAAMAKLLQAVKQASGDSSSLRQSVDDELS